MSWVEDARKLLQDFVAPELRAIAARLDAADEQGRERDKLATERHVALLDKLDATRREIMLQMELSQAKGKIEALEAARNQPSPPPQ